MWYAKETHLEVERRERKLITKKNDREWGERREEIWKKQQCNVWCIAFMDHVKVDVKSMRSSVSLLELWLLPLPAWHNKIENRMYEAREIWVGNERDMLDIFFNTLFLLWIFTLFSPSNERAEVLAKCHWNNIKLRLRAFFLLLFCDFLVHFTHIIKSSRSCNWIKIRFAIFCYVKSSLLVFSLLLHCVWSGIT